MPDLLGQARIARSTGSVTGYPTEKKVRIPRPRLGRGRGTLSRIRRCRCEPGCRCRAGERRGSERERRPAPRRDPRRCWHRHCRAAGARTCPRRCTPGSTAAGGSRSRPCRWVRLGPFRDGRSPARRRCPGPGRAVPVRWPSPPVFRSGSRRPAARPLPVPERGADRRRSSTRSSTAASNRQAVGVEATGPNTSPWSRSQIRDGLAAISQHHREVGGDPARGVAGAAWPKWSHRGGVRAGQHGGIGKISQQPCAA